MAINYITGFGVFKIIHLSFFSYKRDDSLDSTFLDFV